MPSLAGTDAEAVAGIVGRLESRRSVYQVLGDVVEEMAASGDPVVVFVVGEWGEGKTTVVEGFLRSLVEGRGWRLVEVRASTLIEYLRGFGDGFERSPSVRFFAALLFAVAESLGLRVKVSSGLREAALEVLERVAGGGKLVVFIDEFEDIVSAGEEYIATVVAGLVGLVNGDVVEVSARCRGDRCFSGRFHLVVALTPPAYTKMVSVRDIATIVSRLRRRVRLIKLNPIPRWEAYELLRSLLAYSIGVEDPLNVFDNVSLVNPLLVSSMGNAGALVSLIRAIIARSTREGKGCPRRLTASEVRSLFAVTSISVGGAEIPALDHDLYKRVVDGFRKYVESLGLGHGIVEKLEELLTIIVAPCSFLDKNGVREVNEYASTSWLRELGVRRLVYIAKAIPLKRALEHTPSELQHIVNELVFVAPDGSLVVAAPASQDDAVNLTVEIIGSRVSEAEKLLKTLADMNGECLLLASPRLVKSIYANPELSYLDFMAERSERLRIYRRVVSEDHKLSLLVGLAALVGHETIVEDAMAAGETALRLTIRLPVSEARARILLYTAFQRLDVEELHRLESTVTATILSGWRPHAILILPLGGVDEEVVPRLERLSSQVFASIELLPQIDLLSRVKLAAIGLKLLEETETIEEAVQTATRLRELDSSKYGFDGHRLNHVLRELADKVQILESTRKALERGVEGAPLLIRDPELGYDVEKPSELAGALRYYLTVPAPRAKPVEALNAAYNIILNYVIHRHGAGILSPDIDRREVSTLERYTALLVANGMLEKLNGELRIDVLSPYERTVLKALEQLGARSEWVQASNIWDLVVVAARNPGTKKMILQLLAYRGLIETSSKRIDAEKTRVRIVSLEQAKRKILELRERIERLKASYVVRSWGYIVSAKARDYRAGSILGLLKKLETILARAEDAFSTNQMMGFRLVRLVSDMLDYVETELYERMKRASEKAVKLRSLVESMYNGLEERRKLAEDLLSKYVAAEKHVAISINVIDKLRHALEELGKIVDMELEEKEVVEIVQKVWEKALRRSAREPGRHMPFYIAGDGPKYEFNLKLWLIHSMLREQGIIDGGVEDPRPSYTVTSVVERLDRIVETVASSVEEFGKLVRELSSRGLKTSIEIPKAPSKPVLTLEEAEGLVEEWRRKLSERLAEASRLVEVAARLEKLQKMLTKLRLEIRTNLDSSRRLYDEVVEADIPLIARRLEGVIKRMEELLERVEHTLKLVEDVELENIDIATLEEFEGIANTARVEAEKLVEEARRVKRDVELEKERLKVEVEALARILGLRGIEAKGLVDLRKLQLRLVEDIVKKALLEHSEIQAYLTIIRAKREKGELRFSEAARLLARELNIDTKAARKLLLTLIDRELIEPRI